MTEIFHLDNFFESSTDTQSKLKEMLPVEALANIVKARLDGRIYKGETVGIWVGMFSFDVIDAVFNALIKQGYAVSLDARNQLAIT